MKAGFSNKMRVAILALTVAATVSFHYGFIIRPWHEPGALFHALHGRLCYIPIILGAIWFGVRGGLSTALSIILLTLPYGKYRGLDGDSLLMNEYIEMVFYVAIGLTSGILIELQRSERSKSEALQRELSIKEHLSSLGEMAAGLAHEIKNPLGSIRGSAEILSDDYPPGSKKYELLQVLAKEISRLNRVVEEFLSFARPRPLRLQKTDINKTLDTVVSQIEIEAGESGLEIKKNFDTSIREAFFDEEKLHQVFLNIAMNAASCMNRNGRLEITTGRRTFQGKSSITVTFRDTGPGIPKENIEKIFNPFFSTKARGTGLGLSISHIIVQSHGGHMEVDSKPGKGSVFTVILPAKQVN